MNTSEVLYLAADLIEQRGWTTGDGWNIDEARPLCLEGGIQAAMHLNDEDADYSEFVSRPAYAAVRSYLDTDLYYIYDWNDRPERTASEVVGVLRAAAVVEAARESQPAEQVTANV